MKKVKVVMIVLAAAVVIGCGGFFGMKGLCMATHTRGEAYDFELFEPKRKQELQPQPQNNVIRLPREELEKNRRPKHRAFKVISVCTFLVVMLGIVGTFVYGQVRLSELTNEINSTTTELSEQESLYTQLKMKSQAKLSLETVEEYAETQLGMRKLEQNQVEYISLSEGDKGEVLEEDSSENWLTSAWNFIQQLLS